MSNKYIVCNKNTHNAKHWPPRLIGNKILIKTYTPFS